MNDAVKELEEKFNITIPEFTVSAVKKEGELYSQMVLGNEAGRQMNKNLAAALDESLKRCQ